MNKYNVDFTNTFSQMFQYEFYKYYYFSPSYALKLEQKLYETIKLLELFPFVAPSFILDNRSDNYRKFVLQNRFLIIFKISGDYVYLLYFIDARRDSKNYFKI